jgi:hypothetical protein
LYYGSSFWVSGNTSIFYVLLHKLHKLHVWNETNTLILLMHYRLSNDVSFVAATSSGKIQVVNSLMMVGLVLGIVMILS